MRIPRSALVALCGVVLIACDSKESPKSADTPAAEEPATAVKSEQAHPKKKEKPAPPAAEAAVGKPAPDFELTDLDGERFKLSDHKGKVVVLEWFNPGCPFVKNSHSKGSLVTTGDDARKDGVVWVAINSGAPGKQGHGKEANAEAKKKFSMGYPVLLDESGAVGRKYGAAHTPHMFVIDEKGVLAYAGAIDNSPDGEGQSPKGGKLVNYVTKAVAELKAGKPVSEAETKAYGCSVKYGS